MNGAVALEVHHHVTFERNVGVWSNRDYVGEGGAVHTLRPEPFIVIDNELCYLRW